MPRPRRSARGRRARLSAGIWAFLNDEPIPEEEGPARDDYIGLEYFENIVTGHRQTVPLAEIWDAHRAAVLAEWIEERPGSRPKCWWTFDAPPAARRRRDAGDSQAEILDELDMLTDGERAHLATHGWPDPEDAPDAA